MRFILPSHMRFILPSHRAVTFIFLWTATSFGFCIKKYYTVYIIHLGWLWISIDRIHDESYKSNKRVFSDRGQEGLFLRAFGKGNIR